MNNKPSILDAIPKSLPELSYAYEMQKTCAQYGFDWDSLEPVVAKVREEIDEVLEEAKPSQPNVQALELEVGDLLFAVVNLARHLNIAPQQALIRANAKFARRFNGVEHLVNETGKQLKDFDLQELDVMWNFIKAEEIKVVDRKN